MLNLLLPMLELIPENLLFLLGMAVMFIGTKIQKLGEKVERHVSIYLDLVLIPFGCLCNMCYIAVPRRHIIEIHILL